MSCKWCGSNHDSDDCQIRAKADLLLAGFPAEDLFDHVVEIDHKEDVADAIEEIRRSKKRRK